jgi:hypothetical protein
MDDKCESSGEVYDLRGETPYTPEEERIAEEERRMELEPELDALDHWRRKSIDFPFLRGFQRISYFSEGCQDDYEIVPAYQAA